MFSVLPAAAGAWAAALQGLPEYLRPDPFGGILQSDRAAGPALSDYEQLTPESPDERTGDSDNDHQPHR